MANRKSFAIVVFKIPFFIILPSIGLVMEPLFEVLIVDNVYSCDVK